MKTVQYFPFFIFLLTFSATGATSVIPGKSGIGKIEDAVFKNSIYSVQLHRQGWKLSYPVMDLSGGIGLELSFDDITSDISNYYYRIIHCNFDWTPSNLTEGDYLDGYLPVQISRYELSFNTYYSYIHYSLELPNDDFGFLVSGNYAVFVFEDMDESRPVLVRRFMVSDAAVSVSASVNRPVLSMYRNSGHEVNFNIETGSFRVEDPYNDIKVAVLQNGSWIHSIQDLKPLYDRNGLLEYNYQMENVFPAGNEFRWFDIKSMRYQSPYVKSIEFRENRFNVTLFPDPVKSNGRYFYEEDLNGKYYVEIQEEQNDDTDADYVSVAFTLPWEAPAHDGEFYVTGSFCLPVYSEKNRMRYNFDTKSYELSMLLKQGYYNYRYEFLQNGVTAGDPSLTEGDYYETENDYIILVYYRGSSSRYDRLLGYQLANSLKKN